MKIITFMSFLLLMVNPAIGQDYTIIDGYENYIYPHEYIQDKTFDDCTGWCELYRHTGSISLKLLQDYNNYSSISINIPVALPSFDRPSIHRLRECSENRKRICLLTHVHKKAPGPREWTCSGKVPLGKISLKCKTNDKLIKSWSVWPNDDFNIREKLEGSCKEFKVETSLLTIEKEFDFPMLVTLYNEF